MQNRVQRRFSIAGKVFLLGEYAVLAELPALVAAVRPRFYLNSESDSLNSPGSMSPAGRLVKWASAQKLLPLVFSFLDPHQGRGGLGASTAEFALIYQAYAQIADWSRHWNSVWALYRELMVSGAQLTPSGADLVAQWRGGVTFFNPSDKYCLDLWPVFDWTSILIFSTTGQLNRKTATHDHLEELARSGFPHAYQPMFLQMQKPLWDGVSAVKNGELEKFAQALNQYADILSQWGLEALATQEDRKALMDFTDVLAVKGSGAMQSDALIIVLKPKSRAREKIIEAAQGRGLELISNGLFPEIGVSECLISEF